MIDLDDTPVVTVDLDRLEANIARMQAHCDRLGVAFRPHVKTHKAVAVARRQVAAGAAGLTCQTLGEAEAMARAGLDDLLIAVPLLGRAKLERLAALARTARVAVVGDALPPIAAMAARLADEGLRVRLLIECDTGMHRAGVRSPEQAAELAVAVRVLDGVELDGLLTYPTPDDPAVLIAFRDALRRRGLPVRTVSAGGTVQTWRARPGDPATELRAGTYVYGDRGHVAAGVMGWEDCALHVRATVISRAGDRAILDAGSKTLTTDPAEAPGVGGYGRILEHPEAVIDVLSEEHGHVDVSACARRPGLGDVVTIVPNHACGVTNLHDEVVAVRGGRPVERWPVDARGAIR